jgi:hypothetical protein
VGRYVQDVDTDGPGNVTDDRWDVNTGTRCVPSRQCVYVPARSSLTCPGCDDCRIVEECRVQDGQDVEPRCLV